MANGVTSQWEDIHVKLGNYEERPKVETLKETYQKAIEKIEQSEVQKNEDDIDSLEREFDEICGDKLKQYKLQEIEKKKHKRYGQVYECSREEYVREITEASETGFVILSLYQDYIQESLLINNILIEIAADYADVKFVKMIATKCSENFPDSHVPCFIIYHKGKVVSTLQMVHKYLRKITYHAVEYLLKEQGVIAKEQQEDEEIDEMNQQMKNPFKNNRVQGVDDEIKDREYSHKI